MWGKTKQMWTEVVKCYTLKVRLELGWSDLHGLGGRAPEECSHIGFTLESLAAHQGAPGLRIHTPVQETQETHVPSLDWEDALEQETAIHSNIPAWKIPEQRSLPMGSQRIRHDRAHTRSTWSNRQIWPWSTHWSTAKVNTVLPREHMVIANKLFQQHKRWLYTWTSPDGQYWDQIDYILCSRKWRSAIQSAKTRLGADYGSDHELLIAKFRLKLKRVGEITRQFRYDLNQIPMIIQWRWWIDTRY